MSLEDDLKLRADKALVKLGLCSSRSQAELLIKEGKVEYLGKLLKKTSTLVALSKKEDFKIDQPQDFVGRAAQKLHHAKDIFQLNFQDKIIADIGASTGGFTQCCLMDGATKVYAVDVGHDQLHESLLNDQRVQNMEGVNAKFPIELPEQVDYVVTDLSFISLTKVLINMKNILRPGGEIICLVKPQFEVGKKNIPKDGVVKKKEDLKKVLIEIYEHCQLIGLKVVDACSSPIQGRSGNREFLFRVVHENSIDFEEINNEQVFKKVEL